MTELIREWIIGVTAVSLLTAAAKAFAEGTPGEKVIRLAGSVALLLALILPLRGLRIDITGEYRAYMSASGLAEAGDGAGELLCSALERELSAAVAAEASRRGLAVRAFVDCDYSEGAAVPQACRVAAAYDAGLSAWISENLGEVKISFDGG